MKYKYRMVSTSVMLLFPCKWCICVKKTNSLFPNSQENIPKERITSDMNKVKPNNCSEFKWLFVGRIFAAFSQNTRLPKLKKKWMCEFHRPGKRATFHHFYPQLLNWTHFSNLETPNNVIIKLSLCESSGTCPMGTSLFHCKSPFRDLYTPMGVNKALAATNNEPPCWVTALKVQHAGNTVISWEMEIV